MTSEDVIRMNRKDDHHVQRIMHMYDASRVKGWRCALALTAILLLPLVVSAVPAIPLNVGNTDSARDEYGDVLTGTARKTGALVQVLAAPSGVHPPSRFGTPHPDNEVIREFRIGEGTDPEAGSIGLFAGSLNINRYASTPMFVRVFNRSSGRDSSFYGDSEVFVNDTTRYSAFLVGPMQTDIPLDPADDDKDGLNNSWEKSVGSDSLTDDSDGDGISDLKEMMSGTNPLDSGDYLRMLEIIPQPDGTLMVVWDAASNVVYQVEQSLGDLMDPSAEFVEINAVVTSRGDKAYTIITNDPGVERQHFRVKAVDNQSPNAARP